MKTKNKKPCGFLLYWHYLYIQFKAGLQYKGWPLMILQTFLIVITDPISTVLLFARFGSIGEWSMERILLVYSMAVTSFGLAETFARGFDSFPYHMVQNGDFDRILLRPRSTFLQVAASVFHLHRLARVISGLGVCLWCLTRLGVPMDFGRVALFCYALLGGLILYCGVFVLTSGISFFTIKGIDWIYLFTNAGYQVTRCPICQAPCAVPLPFWCRCWSSAITPPPSSAVGGSPFGKGFWRCLRGFCFWACP